MMQTIAKEQLDNEASAYYCSSRILDDGIIDPRDTRFVERGRASFLMNCVGLLLASAYPFCIVIL
jgi:acetyl-CoA carboxylase carboxyltransferase component